MMSGKEVRRCVFAVVVFVTMTALLPGGAFAGVIFSDDFESGTLLTSDVPAGQWASKSESSGTITIASSPDPVFDGTYSCHHYRDGGTSVYLRSPQWEGVTDLYCKVFVRVHDWSGYWGILRLLADHPTLNDIVCNVFANSTDHLLVVSRGPAGDPANGWGRLATGTTVLEEDRWYCVELYYQHCTAAGNADGRVTVWLDGNVEMDVQGVDSSDGADVYPVDRWILGMWDAMAGDVYFDNALVSDTRVVNLEVLLPVGGEDWGVGGVQKILWISDPDVTNVHIELSRDGGTNWEDIDTAAPDTGSYTWDVTGAESSDCIIRLTGDDGPPGTQTESNAAFNISAPSITVVAPNGGESWAAGYAKSIEWETNLGDGTGDVEIAVSYYGGSAYTVLATSSPNDGVTLFAIPDNPSTQCRIRIASAATGASDESDAEFTITAKSWDAVFADDFESGFIGADEGGQWDHVWPSDQSSAEAVMVPVRDGTYAARLQYDNTGSAGDVYTTVNAIEDLDVGELAEICVEGYVYMDSMPQGDASYSLNLVTVGSESEGGLNSFYVWSSDLKYWTSRNPLSDGGEGDNWPNDVALGTAGELTLGTWHKVEFYYRTSTVEGASDGVTRLYVDDVMVGEATGLDTCGGDNDGTLYVPDRIRLCSYAGHWEDPSENILATVYWDDVTISAVDPAERPRVTSPRGGEDWAVESIYDITWNMPGAVGNVRIEISRDAGENWETVVYSTPNDGARLWLVTEPTSEDCIIRISDAAGGGMAAQSLRTFSIVHPYVEVLSPNGGESFVSGDAQIITWKAPGIDKVQIAVSYDGGTTYEVLTRSTANDGASFFGVPDAESTQCRIRITAVEDASITDQSDADFSISPPEETMLFSDGFESGHLTEAEGGAWDSVYVTDQSTVAIEETTVFAGDYAAKLHHDNTDSSDDTTTVCSIVKSLDVSASEFRCRAELLFEAVPAAGYATSLLDVASVDGKSVCTLYLMSNMKLVTNRKSISDGLWGDNSPAARGSTVLEVGQWYTVELYFRHSSVDGAKDGCVAVFLDGELEALEPGIRTSDGETGDTTYPLARASIGAWTGSSEGINQVVYADDFECGRQEKADCTWDGGGTTNSWSEAANWSGDVVPGVHDTALFDETSSKDCEIEVGATVGTIVIDADYSGTVAVSSSVTVIRTLSQDGGTVEFSGAGSLTVGTYNRTGGILRMDSGEQAIRLSSLLVSGGTVDLTGGCLIEASGDVDISGDGTLVADNVKLTMNGGSPSTISMSGEGNIVGGRLELRKQWMTGARVSGNVRCEYLRHLSGSLNIIGCTLEVLGSYVGSWYSTLRVYDGGEMLVGHGDYGYSTVWKVSSGWRCDLARGPISVWGNASSTSKTVWFDRASGFWPGYGEFRLRGSSPIGLCIADSASVAFHDLTIGDGAEALAVTLSEESGRACTVLGKLTISENATLDANGQELCVCNWNNEGSFVASGGKVEMAGEEPSIRGDTQFGVLACSGTALDIVAGTSIGAEELVLQGTSEDLLVLRSSEAGTPWNLDLTGPATVRYVDVQDSNASGGLTVYAVDSTDSGNNTNWIFDATVKIALIVPDEGPMQGGTEVRVNGIGFDETATVTFGGVAAASVTFIDGCNLVAVTPEHDPGAVDVQVTCAAGSDTLTEGYTYVYFIVPPTGLVASKLGGEVSLTWDEHPAEYVVGYNVYRMASGESEYTRLNGELVTEKSYVDSTGSPGVQYWYAVTAADADEIESGYSDPAMAPEVVVTTGDDSYYSPVCLEGTCSEGTLSVTVSPSGGDPVAAVLIGPTKWYADVPLADDAATAMTIVGTGTGDSTHTIEHSVTWDAMDIPQWSDIFVRKGDSLLLTQTGEGTVLEIDPGTGTWENAGAPGDTLQVTFDSEGTATVGSRIDAGAESFFDVTAVSVNLHGPIACKIGFKRKMEVGVSPGTAIPAMHFCAGDAADLLVELSGEEPEEYDVLLYLETERRGGPRLLAKLEDGSGPILASQEVDEYTFETTASYILKLHDVGDGWRMGTATMTMTPLVTDLDCVLTMISSNACFEGGMTEVEYDTSDFVLQPDGSGTFEYDIYLPEGGFYFCHEIKLYQSHSPQNNETGGPDGLVNGAPVDGEEDEEPPTWSVTVVGPQPDPGCIDQSISFGLKTSGCDVEEWRWVPSDTGVASEGSSFSHTFAAEGHYTVAASGTVLAEGKHHHVDKGDLEVTITKVTGVSGEAYGNTATDGERLPLWVGDSANIEATMWEDVKSQDFSWYTAGGTIADATALVTTYTASASGLYEVEARCWSGGPKKSFEVLNVEATVTADKPVAWKGTGPGGQPIAFTAEIESGGATPDKIEWKFGDGEWVEGSESEEHTFDETGEYSVGLRLTFNEKPISKTLCEVKVIELVGLEVDDVESLGGNEYATPRGEGNITITPKTNPTVSADELPTEGLTWSGDGSPSADNRTCSLSKGTMGKYSVSAEAAGDEHTVVIWVCTIHYLYVDGAQSVPDAEEEYITQIQAAGDVVVEAWLEPFDVPKERLPESFVQWKGGAAGDDATHRNLSKSTAGSFTIAATCGNTRQVLIHVCEVGELIVTGATKVDEGNMYMTLKGAETVGIQAKLNPDLPLEKLPGDSFVAWTGGDEGADQLHRMVSTSSVRDESVTATCGASSKSVQIVVCDITLSPDNAYICVEDSQVFTCQVFPAAAMGGTYEWGWNGPGQAQLQGTGWTATFSSGDPGVYGVFVTYRKGECSMSIQSTITVVKVDLAANGHDFSFPMAGNIGIPEDSEDTEGAYVHFNVDNDDESGGGTSKYPGGDFLQAGPVPGENDLKLLVATLEPSDIRAGQVVLRRSSAAVQVWSSAEKGASNAVLVGDTYASDTEGNGKKTWVLPGDRSTFDGIKGSLWVEGRDLGTATVTLSYEVNGEVLCSDTVKYTFIAATCGDQPAVARRNILNGAFPELVNCEWSVTAGATPTYNCIAWSVGETGTSYNADDIDRDFGDNNGIFEDSDMDAFYLAKKGWLPNAAGASDAEAIYYRLPTDWDYGAGDPFPTPGYHGAKKKTGCMCGDGKWIMFESKCGEIERIEHVWDQLEASAYGSDYQFYK